MSPRKNVILQGIQWATFRNSFTAWIKNMPAKNEDQMLAWSQLQSLCTLGLGFSEDQQISV